METFLMISVVLLGLCGATFAAITQIKPNSKIIENPVPLTLISLCGFMMGVLASIIIQGFN